MVLQKAMRLLTVGYLGLRIQKVALLLLPRPNCAGVEIEVGGADTFEELAVRLGQKASVSTWHCPPSRYGTAASPGCGEVSIEWVLFLSIIIATTLAARRAVAL